MVGDESPRKRRGALIAGVHVSQREVGKRQIGVLRRSPTVRGSLLQQRHIILRRGAVAEVERPAAVGIDGNECAGGAIIAERPRQNQQRGNGQHERKRGNPSARHFDEAHSRPQQRA